MSEIDKKLKSILELVYKATGNKESITVVGNKPQPIEAVSSSILPLDIALGIGGYPRGRIIEAFGAESAGKTTLCLQALAYIQSKGMVGAFIDAEHSLDMAYAVKLGVKEKELLLSQPDSGEQAMTIASTLATSNQVDMVIVDSVSAMVPQAEIDGEMGDSKPGLQARLMSQSLRRLAGEVRRSKAILIFVNQIRQRIMQSYGNPETTSGGMALKFYATMRIDVRKGETIKVGDQPVGHIAKIKVVKNKVASPFRIAEVELRYGKGFWKPGYLLDMAVTDGIVEKSGAWYSFNGNRIGQGRDNTAAALEATPGTLLEIETALNNKYFPKS